MIKEFLERISKSNETLAHDGSLMADGNVFVKIYKKYRKIFVGVLLFVFLLPSIFFARYGGKDGMIYSLVLLSFVGTIALVEVLNNFRISRVGQFVIILVFLWSVFTPFSLLVEIGEKIKEDNWTKPASYLFSQAYPWHIYVAFGASSLIFIFDHSKSMSVWFQIKRYIYILITLVVTTGMVKGVFIMSVHWTNILMLNFGVIILTDVFGTIGGKYLSKYFPWKLAPNISPNKTIIGAISGIVMAATLFLSISYLTPIWDPYIKLVGEYGLTNVDIWIWIAAIGFPVIAIFGDLFFSSMKRMMRIKDFSSLITGHGGIFDRLDSHAFVFTMGGFMFLIFDAIYPLVEII